MKKSITDAKIASGVQPHRRMSVIRCASAASCSDTRPIGRLATAVNAICKSIKSIDQINIDQIESIDRITDHARRGGGGQVVAVLRREGRVARAEHRHELFVVDFG